MQYLKSLFKFYRNIFIKQAIIKTTIGIEMVLFSGIISAICPAKDRWLPNLYPCPVMRLIRYRIKREISLCDPSV